MAGLLGSGCRGREQERQLSEGMEGDNSLGIGEGLVIGDGVIGGEDIDEDGILIEIIDGKFIITVGVIGFIMDEDGVREVWEGDVIEVGGDLIMF